MELAAGDRWREMTQISGDLDQKFAGIPRILGLIERVDMFLGETEHARSALFVVKTKVCLEDVLSLVEADDLDLDAMKTPRPGVYFRPGGSTHTTRSPLRIFDGSQCPDLPSEYKLFAIGQVAVSLELGSLGPRNAKALNSAARKLPDAPCWTVSGPKEVPVGDLLLMFGQDSLDGSAFRGARNHGPLLETVLVKHQLFWCRPGKGEAGMQILLKDEGAAGKMLASFEQIKRVFERFLYLDSQRHKGNLGELRVALRKQGRSVRAEIDVPRGFLSDLLILIAEARERTGRAIRDRGLDTNF
jgi:hypothetical protein